jgi:2-dehydropantoate 2-reductase
MAKIAIVGCGAMGSVYAALMVSAGHQVHAISLWADHVLAMQTNGLRVEGASGDRTVPIQAGTTTNGIGHCDLVIIATKAFDVEAAARAALPLLGKRTVVQTIQNGLGSADKVAAIVGEDRVAMGVVGGFGASMRAPGHAHHNGMEMIRFGPYKGLPPSDLEEAAEIWRSAGFRVALFQDTKQMVWEKLIMNVAFSGTTCSTGLTIGEVMNDPNAWWVAKSCAEEAIAVAQAAGIHMDIGDPIEHVRNLGSKIPDARPSMLLDFNLRRRGEVDAINGSIVLEGEKYGVPTPINRAVVAIIKARESAFSPESA